MGLLSKLGQKLGDAVEKSASKNMSGTSKEVYESEKIEKADALKNKESFDMIETEYSKDELKDLQNLLKRAKLVDEHHLWIAGFPNFKANQNAKAANLFSGKTNLRFFCVNGDLYSFAMFEKNSLKTYKVFRKDAILKFEAKSKLMGASTFKVELRDKTVFTIDITENKEMLEALRNLLS